MFNSVGSSPDRSRNKRAHVESLEYQWQTMNVSDEIEEPAGIKIKSALKVSLVALWNRELLKVLNSWLLVSKLNVRLIIVSEVGECIRRYRARERKNNKKAVSVKDQRVNILDFTGHMISLQLSARPLEHKFAHKHYTNGWTWPCSYNFLFIGSKIWISYNFHIIKHNISFDYFSI